MRDPQNIPNSPQEDVEKPFGDEYYDDIEGIERRKHSSPKKKNRKSSPTLEVQLATFYREEIDDISKSIKDLETKVHEQNEILVSTETDTRRTVIISNIERLRDQIKDKESRKDILWNKLNRIPQDDQARVEAKSDFWINIFRKWFLFGISALLGIIGLIFFSTGINSGLSLIVLSFLGLGVNSVRGLFWKNLKNVDV